MAAARASGRPPSFSVSFTLVRIAANAGASPQTIPVSTASAKRKTDHPPIQPNLVDARQRLRQQPHAHPQRDRCKDEPRPPPRRRSAPGSPASPATAALPRSHPAPAEPQSRAGCESRAPAEVRQGLRTQSAAQQRRQETACAPAAAPLHRLLMQRPTTG